jgi:hypothetical protein
LNLKLGIITSERQNILGEIRIEVMKESKRLALLKLMPVNKDD